MKQKSLKLLPLLKDIAFYRRVLIAIMALLVLIRPTTSTEPSERQVTNLNVWFVVDATGSMVAKDVANGSKRRFEQVQDDMVYLAEHLPGSRFGMIAQDFSTYVASPMSSSADSIVAAKPYAHPKYSYYSQPTSLSDLLSYSAERIAKYKERYEDRINVLVFMSDGEDLTNNTISVPSNLANLVKSAVVFGYGSTNGTTIEHIGKSSDEGYDYSGITDELISYYGNDSRITVDSHHNVISKIDETNLKSIASSLRGSYYHRESGDVPAEVINNLKASATIIDADGSSTTSAGEIYYIFALILLILLFWEGEETLTRILAERKHA